MNTSNTPFEKPTTATRSGSLFAKSGATGEQSEVQIDTGEEHSAFYRPHPEWVTPVLEWIRD